MLLVIFLFSYSIILSSIIKKMSKRLLTYKMIFFFVDITLNC